MGWHYRLEEAERRLAEIAGRDQDAARSAAALWQSLREAEYESIFGGPFKQPTELVWPTFTEFRLVCRWGTSAWLSAVDRAVYPFTVNSGHHLVLHALDFTQHTSTYHAITTVYNIGFAVDFSTGAATLQVKINTDFGSNTDAWNTYTGGTPGRNGTLDGLVWPVYGTPLNEGTQAPLGGTLVRPTVAGVLATATTITFDFAATSALGWAFQDGDAVVTMEVV